MHTSLICFHNGIKNFVSLCCTMLQKNKPRGRRYGRKCGRGDKGQGQRGTLPRLGFEGGQTPFYLKIPKEPYYAGRQ